MVHERLGNLVCGQTNENMYELKTILDLLNDTITKFTKKIKEFEWTEGSSIDEIPFYGRNILEASFTALIGRIDPFRVIIVHNVQLDSSYDIGKKSTVAIQWKGDIIASSPPKPKLWDSQNKKDDFNRAILGNYYGEILWKKAYQRAIDYTGDRGIESQWITELGDRGEDAFFERCKSKGEMLFSSFSKGVHYEFLTNSSNTLDLLTTKTLVIDMIRLCAEVGLLSHFVGYTLCSLEIDLAISYFMEIEEWIKNV